ncbi:hypothetical protein SAMN02745174_02640 [Cetobacterium ceti]|uniref:Uncharacterized protein n=1 Tax=Cetobacterium ceti TaxID=180163 RepID=A0A1T4RCF0_9FUSO|nr:hypothetical protein [Cetobacterium ceti]SKA13301.1 hypothetical protein SAMN02745174_02640 [Cetobacterium ceti]
MKKLIILIFFTLRTLLIFPNELEIIKLQRTDTKAVIIISSLDYFKTAVLFIPEEGLEIYLNQVDNYENILDIKLVGEKNIEIYLNKYKGILNFEKKYIDLIPFNCL